MKSKADYFLFSFLSHSSVLLSIATELSKSYCSTSIHGTKSIAQKRIRETEWNSKIPTAQQKIE